MAPKGPKRTTQVWRKPLRKWIAVMQLRSMKSLAIISSQCLLEIDEIFSNHWYRAETILLLNTMYFPIQKLSEFLI
jgi:hypothetical protein